MYTGRIHFIFSTCLVFLKRRKLKWENISGVSTIIARNKTIEDIDMKQILVVEHTSKNT